VIVDPRFESFLYGRATSEQIRLLRSMGASLRFLCREFKVGERRLKQCERTLGDFVYIPPTPWMAAPVLCLPKGGDYCIRKFQKNIGHYTKFKYLHYTDCMGPASYWSFDLEKAWVLKAWAEGFINTIKDVENYEMINKSKNYYTFEKTAIKKNNLPNFYSIPYEVYHQIKKIEKREEINKRMKELNAPKILFNKKWEKKQFEELEKEEQARANIAQ